jgi:type 1 glutamine amidotransferase
MKKSVVFLFVFLAALPAFAGGGGSGEKNVPNVLLVTGGHEYDEEGFNRLLGELSVTICHVRHPDAYAMWEAEKLAPFDVILLYDMPKEIGGEARDCLKAALQGGKGLVALHHAFCSYDGWPEYAEMIGGRFHHYPWTENGAEKPPSTYKHGVTFSVRVADGCHPITNGVTDFEATDETYAGVQYLEGIHPLLVTSEPSSGAFLCWTNNYRGARVAAFTLGHDRAAWENPSFIRILSQAIYWAGDFEPSR